MPADPSSSTSSAQAAPPEVKIRVRVATWPASCRGSAASVVARDVGKVVDRWFEAAYLGGEYPRSRFRDSWPGFTAGARDLARHDRKLTSNAVLGDADRRRAGHRQGSSRSTCSARTEAGRRDRALPMVFRTTGDAERRVAVFGRLLLTKVKGRWRVFGFDVKKSVDAGRCGQETTGDKS